MSHASEQSDIIKNCMGKNTELTNVGTLPMLIFLAAVFILDRKSTCVHHDAENHHAALPMMLSLVLTHKCITRQATYMGLASFWIAKDVDIKCWSVWARCHFWTMASSTMASWTPNMGCPQNPHKCAYFLISEDWSSLLSRCCLENTDFRDTLLIFKVCSRGA